MAPAGFLISTKSIDLLWAITLGEVQSMHDANRAAGAAAHFWSPLLVTAQSFESGAVLQAMIGIHDHESGEARWRVTRRRDDERAIIGSGVAFDLDGAAAAAGAFIAEWRSDGAKLGAVAALDV